MQCDHPNPYNDAECPECGVPIENWEPNDNQIPGTYEIQKAA